MPHTGDCPGLGTVGVMKTRDDHLADLHRDSVWFDLALATAILVVTMVLLALVLR